MGAHKQVVSVRIEHGVDTGATTDKLRSVIILKFSPFKM